MEPPTRGALILKTEFFASGQEQDAASDERETTAGVFAIREVRRLLRQMLPFVCIECLLTINSCAFTDLFQAGFIDEFWQVCHSVLRRVSKKGQRSARLDVDDSGFGTNDAVVAQAMLNTLSNRTVKSSLAPSSPFTLGTVRPFGGSQATTHSSSLSEEQEESSKILEAEESLLTMELLMRVPGAIHCDRLFAPLDCAALTFQYFKLAIGEQSGALFTGGVGIPLGEWDPMWTSQRNLQCLRAVLRKVNPLYNDASLALSNVGRNEVTMSEIEVVNPNEEVDDSQNPQSMRSLIEPYVDAASFQGVLLTGQSAVLNHPSLMMDFESGDDQGRKATSGHRAQGIRLSDIVVAHEGIDALTIEEQIAEAE